jgi:ABC-2 type transport system permease protein
MSTAMTTDTTHEPAAPTGPTAPHSSATAFTTLTARRMTLTMRNPRSILLPLATPMLIAVVIAPALATIAGPVAGIDFTTYLAVGTAALVVPLSCMQAGLGVIVDRNTGALPDLLAAPVRRPVLVLANLAAAVTASALQVITLIAFAAWRGATFRVSATGVLWFTAAAVTLAVASYGIAETLANRIDSEAEYVNAIPTLGIAPWFFAGSLFPITAMPAWITAIAKVLPVTHAVAIMRYAVVDRHGVDLHAIWGLTSPTTMAALSLTVLVAYATGLTFVAVKVFKRAAAR